MKRSIVICDENLMHLSYLSQTIEAYDSDSRFEVREFSDGVELDRVLDSIPVDIAIVDVSMSGTHCMHLCRHIREIHPDAMIILVTESNSFDIGAYELRAAYYLVKPVMAYKINSILDELRDGEENKDPASVKLKWFSIETKKRTIRVAFEDITYIEKDQRKVVVHTQIGSWDFYGTFKEVRALLDMDKMFVQCHQGYIVNMHWVAVLEPNGLKLSDNTWIPVSRRFRHLLEDAFEKDLM